MEQVVHLLEVDGTFMHLLPGLHLHFNPMSEREEEH